MTYLGGVISCDGRANAEIIRRIGEGRVIFEQLHKLWRHANITIKKKIEIYKACVVSKILYSLESLWLLKNDCARLDAFHYMCLRKMLKIPHSFISRISNDIVLERAGEKKLSTLLEERQIKIFRKIQMLPLDNHLRKLVCDNDGNPVIWYQRRRRGRPRQEWTNSIYRKIVNDIR